jgi:D-glycero-D-manno-heptose 1,7-bisphosphate phosphatase
LFEKYSYILISASKDKNMMLKMMFFGLDGVLREPISDSSYITHPRDQQPIAKMVEAVNHYTACGFICMGISNQGGCEALNPATGKPWKSIEDAISEEAYTLELFPDLRYIYFCPDFAGRQCWQLGRKYDASPLHLSWGGKFITRYRKPNDGMIQAAILNFGGEIKIQEAWVVGNRDDAGCADKSGIDFIPAERLHEQFAPDPDRLLLPVHQETLNKFLAI